MTLVPMVDLRQHPEDEEPDAVPCSIEAEQAALGIVLLDNEHFHLAVGLQPEHFIEPFHSRLWAAMSERIGKGVVAEPIVIMERFRSDPAFEELGGLRYLADLVDHAPPGAYMAGYAETIIDTWQRRQLIGLAHDVIRKATTSTVETRETVAVIEQGLAALDDNTEKTGGFQPFSDAVDAALELAALAYARDGEVSGISTGLMDLDAKLGGMHASDLIILAGRPSMGKTALATTIAFNAASHYHAQEQADGTMKRVRGARVGFFSLEMSKDQLATRLMADAAGVSSDRVRKGELDAVEFGRFRDAADLIRSIPLEIDETGAISITRLAARARRLKRQKGLDLIVVDYLQLAAGGDRYRGNRVQEVTEITSGLKALAKELKVPVLALSQLSRKTEDRDDKRPQLADLRDSGSIEQDADVVMFVHREEYYLSRSEPRPDTPEHLAWLVELEKVQGQAEVILGKQRHGPIGTVRVAFNGETTRFRDLARASRYGGDNSTLRMPYGGDE